MPELAVNDDRDSRSGETNDDGDDHAAGVNLPRLYHLIFSPRWADLAAVLSYLALRENFWAVCELASIAVTQLWAGATAHSRLFLLLFRGGGGATTKTGTSPSMPPSPTAPPTPTSGASGTRTRRACRAVGGGRRMGPGRPF